MPTEKTGCTFDEHAHTSNNVGAEIIADRLEGVLLQLRQKEEEFATGFCIRRRIDPFDALAEGQVRPVGCAGVHVLREEFVLEEILVGRELGVPLFHAGEMGNRKGALFSDSRHCRWYRAQRWGSGLGMGGFIFRLRFCFFRSFRSPPHVPRSVLPLVGGSVYTDTTAPEILFFLLFFVFSFF